MAAASRWLLKLGGKKTTLSSRKSEIVALLTQILLANKQRTVKSK
jgi:hypothetical protein